MMSRRAPGVRVAAGRGAADAHAATVPAAAACEP